MKKFKVVLVNGEACKVGANSLHVSSDCVFVELRSENGNTVFIAPTHSLIYVKEFVEEVQPEA